jgi:Glutathione-dependent formaldehyde-activating enzyme
MSMIVRDEYFQLSGQTVRYDRKAESGNIITTNFCAHCHGLLWSVPAHAICT